MSEPLRLTIATPATVLVQDVPIVALRAEDASGSFGILPGHVDFLTLLTPSVLRWRGADGITHFCAVSSGVLRVSGGREVSLACREAIPGDDLPALEARIRDERASQLDAMRRARVEETRLHAQAVRQLLRYLAPGAAAAGPRGGQAE